MTFMLLIPLLLATPTSWTLHRVSSIKYPPIYHNPPPLPPPFRFHCFAYYFDSTISLSYVLKDSSYGYISFGFPPSHLSPLCTLLQPSAGPPSSPFLPLFTPPFLLSSFLLGQDPRRSLFLTIFGAFVIV